MASLDLFENPTYIPEETIPTPELPDGDFVLNVQDNANQPCSAPAFDKWVYFGKSFEYEGPWESGKMYYSDDHRTSFVSYNNYLLACNKTHESSVETEPEILFDEGIAKGVNNIYWKLVLTGEVGDWSTIERTIGALKKVVYKNQSNIETQQKANTIVANQVQKSSERIQSLENYKSTSGKEINNLKAAVEANIAFPWIGSEDDYLALVKTEEFNPGKLYFTYEE